jgi:multidrug resistance efflux pump
MTMIRDAKCTFNIAIESELDEIGAEIARLAARCREAAKDATRLNDLAASFNGVASTLELAGQQVEDARNEARAWLGVTREPIHQYVSPTVTFTTEAAA